MHEIDKNLGEVKNGILLVETPSGYEKDLVEKIVENNEDVVILAPQKRFYLQNIKAHILGPDEITVEELYTISLKLRELRNKIIIALFISALINIHGTKKTYQFLNEISKVAKNTGSIIVLFVNPKILDEKEISMIEDLADYIVEVKEVVIGLNIKRGIRVKKGKTPSDFYEYR